MEIINNAPCVGIWIFDEHIKMKFLAPPEIFLRHQANPELLDEFRFYD